MVKEYLDHSWHYDPEIGYDSMTLFFNVDFLDKHTLVDYFEVPDSESYDIDLLITEDNDLYGIEIFYPDDLAQSENPVLPDVDVKVKDHTYKLFDVIKYICENETIDEE